MAHREGRSRSSLQRAMQVAVTTLSCVASAAGAEPSGHVLRVSSLFMQAGIASDARAYVLGATWDWSWRKQMRWGEVTGYWESSIGQWRTRNAPGGDSSSLVTQVGVTPVLRWHPSAFHERLFLELGVGANVLFPIYQTEKKRFSTAFNFGDHLAVGWREGRHEFALRLQHFSNAGIKSPNPGEDFVQLRYAIRY